MSIIMRLLLRSRTMSYLSLYNRVTTVSGPCIYHEGDTTTLVAMKLLCDPLPSMHHCTVVHTQSWFKPPPSDHLLYSCPSHWRLLSQHRAQPIIRSMADSVPAKAVRVAVHRHIPPSVTNTEGTSYHTLLQPHTLFMIIP